MINAHIKITKKKNNKTVFSVLTIPFSMPVYGDWYPVLSAKIKKKKRKHYELFDFKW